MTYTIKQNTSLHAIASMFEDKGRKEQFSLYGLEAIMDYLEECSEDGTIDLDVIGICCDFTEESPEDVLDGQGWALGAFEDGSGGLSANLLLQGLNEETWAVALDNGNILYINY